MVDALRASIKRDFLRRGHDDRTGERDRLHNRELNVAGAGRQIEHEIIELAPFDLSQELLRVSRDHRSAQNRRRSVIEQEPHRHQFQVVLLDRDDPILFGGHRAIADAEHEGNAWAVNIAIAKSDTRAGFFQGYSEIGRDGRFSHAAFAARDRDDVFDSFDAGRADAAVPVPAGGA